MTAVLVVTESCELVSEQVEDLTEVKHSVEGAAAACVEVASFEITGLVPVEMVEGSHVAIIEDRTVGLLEGVSVKRLIGAGEAVAEVTFV